MFYYVLFWLRPSDTYVLLQYCCCNTSYDCSVTKVVVCTVFPGIWRVLKQKIPCCPADFRPCHLNDPQLFTLHHLIVNKINLSTTSHKTGKGAGRSSEVERSLMVRWVVGSILHGVDPLSYFSFQPVLYDWCNKGRGMCYPVCGMVHIKEPLLLIGKSSLCGGSGFPFSLSEWSLTICLTPYNRR